MSGVPPGYKIISTGYEPRPLQHNLHLVKKRFKVIVCHRRFGKTVWALNDKLDKGLRNTLRNPQYAYLAPNYGQAKRVAWEYLKQYTSKIPGFDPNESDLRVDIHRPSPFNDRVRFMLLGAEKPETLKGIYLDGVVLDEYAEMNPVAWREVILPTLSDRGGWANFIGTPKGRNHFYDLWNNAGDPNGPDATNWYRAMFKASETGILSAEELVTLRANMTEEEYEQELECSFAAGMVGAYFAKEMARAETENRITNVPYDPALLVDTWWDLGINDVSAVWFTQKYGAQYRIVDYFEEPDLNIPQLVNRCRDMTRKFNCVLGAVNLPHDAKVRELSTGKSRQEVFISLGVRPKIIPKVEDKLDSIHAARMIIPKCVFDRDRCKKGIDSLLAYQRKWDSKAGVFSTKPLHNWASNGADAFQQLAMGTSDRAEVNPANLPKSSDFNYDVFNIEGGT